MRPRRRMVSLTLPAIPYLILLYQTTIWETIKSYFKRLSTLTASVGILPLVACWASQRWISPTWDLRQNERVPAWVLHVKVHLSAHGVVAVIDQGWHALLYVRVLFGRCLIVIDIQVVKEGLWLFWWHLALLLQVKFVPYCNFGETAVLEFEEVDKPVINAMEGLEVSDVVG